LKLKTDKTTIVTLSDHPLSPSGVGTQTKYVLEALLQTGKYRVISFGGAIKHANYEPVRIDPYGEDWVVHPVDGYGSPDMIRSVLRTERVDMIWFMTDPRFYGWLWEMEDEIRPLCPMVYYHVWDNYPYPDFNAKWYNSTDVIACISKLTYDIVQNVAPNVESHYVPHAVDSNVFRPHDRKEVEEFSLALLNSNDNLDDKVTFFWNNRNARRKQSGSLLFWFNEFLNRVGRDKARLIMHTEPKDPNGQDLEAILHNLELVNGEVYLSTSKLPSESLSLLYNMADCTINIADAEGFGLATLESLSCGTPIIATMTGGLQEQVTDGENFFGIGLEPTSKAIIGSQQVPYIYEDRLSQEVVVNALEEMYNKTAEQRAVLGLAGRNHVMTNYSFAVFRKNWVELIDKVVLERGSWENRKMYKSWHFQEVV
jgi:glycosyltransferase involved in cell wall biosynthesis